MDTQPKKEKGASTIIPEQDGFRLIGEPEKGARLSDKSAMREWQEEIRTEGRTDPGTPPRQRRPQEGKEMKAHLLKF